MSSKRIVATVSISKNGDVATFFKRICDEVLDIHFLKIPRTVLYDPDNITADDLLRLILHFGIDLSMTISYVKNETTHHRVAKGVKKKRDSLRKRPVVKIVIEDI